MLPRGGDTATLNWVQLVQRNLGDKKSYININGKRDVNLIPVEKFGVYQCPERSTQSGAPFLDYVVNAMDSRGPTNDTCQPLKGNWTATQNYFWREVKGCAPMTVWKHPARVIYIIDAASESQVINKQPTQLKQIRLKINTIRSTPGISGLDSFDVFRGGQVPALPRDTDSYPATDNDPVNGYGHSTGWVPRAAATMHSNRFSNALFADGHAGPVMPPDDPAAPSKAKRILRRYMAYLRLFGVPVPNAVYNNATFSLMNAAAGTCQGKDIPWYY